MKHIRKFNESEDFDYIDLGHVHDKLIYYLGLHVDLDAYSQMVDDLNVEKIPQEAQDLIQDIDSIIDKIAPELRKKIIDLYKILSGEDIDDDIEY